FGAPPVKLDPKLSQLARDFAQDMQKRDFFAHTNPDGLSAQQRARKAGIVPGVYENLGWQQGPESAEQLVDALEKSFMDEPDG
ncbi:CAP domain-containing protein, partial [Acinetobacter baumannii]